MKKFTKLNENKLELISVMISDIDSLVDNLEYLRDFLKEKVDEKNQLNLYRTFMTVHTDIQLLSKKINK